MKKWWSEFLGRVVKDVREMKWVILGIVGYWVFTRVFFRAFCPMLLISGLPCAGCGMTRATLQLLMLHVEEAWRWNPAVFAWVIWGIYAVGNRYLIGRKIPYQNATLGVTLFLTLAVYVIRMTTCFPSEMPLMYREENLMASLFPWYKNVLKILWPI